MSAVTFTECPFDFSCLTDGTAAIWSGDRIRELAAHDPGFALALLDRATSLVLEVTARIDALAFLDARRRLARAFVKYGDLVFDERRPTISRSDLPALVGTSREMVARCLRYFEARGVLTRVGRTGLVLLDETGLREYLESARDSGRRAYPTVSADDLPIRQDRSRHAAAAIRSRRLISTSAIETTIAIHESKPLRAGATSSTALARQIRS